MVKHKVKRTSQIWMKSTIFDFSSKWVMSKIIARACHLVLLFPASSSSKWGEFHLVPALSSRWRQYTLRQQSWCTFCRSCYTGNFTHSASAWHFIIGANIETAKNALDPQEEHKNTVSHSANIPVATQ